MPAYAGIQFLDSGLRRNDDASIGVLYPIYLQSVIGKAKRDASIEPIPITENHCEESFFSGRRINLPLVFRLLRQKTARKDNDFLFFDAASLKKIVLRCTTPSLVLPLSGGECVFIILSSGKKNPSPVRGGTGWGQGKIAVIQSLRSRRGI